jgi:hypothetical protein
LAGDNWSYLIETSKGESAIVHSILKEYAIMEIQPIHFEMNGKPLLFAQMGVAETDNVWTSLLVFSEDGYQIMGESRVKTEVTQE